MRRACLVGLPGTRNRRLKPDTPTASDLVDRKFTRDGANQLCVTDGGALSTLTFLLIFLAAYGFVRLLGVNAVESIGGRPPGAAARCAPAVPAA